MWPKVTLELRDRKPACCAPGDQCKLRVLRVVSPPQDNWQRLGAFWRIISGVCATDI